MFNISFKKLQDENLETKRKLSEIKARNKNVEEVRTEFQKTMTGSFLRIERSIQWYEFYTHRCDKT